MADRRDNRWEGDSFYAEDQIAAILREIGIDVDGYTEAVFLAYCPYHGNRDTPSFAVNKTDGTYICFNPSCNKSGGLERLIKNVAGLNDFQIKRLIARSKSDKSNIMAQLEKVTEDKQLWTPYVRRNDKGEVVEADYMNRVKRDMWKYAEPQLYMRGRGFEKQTLKDFEIGYDLDLDMVCVPMHDPMGSVEVGAVRRSIQGKSFKNTPGLPTSRTLFNLHRAKKTGDVVVVVEASFSAMRLTQVGYPNVVSLLMGHFSKDHARLLGKYFNTVVIMTDWDDKQYNDRNGNICQKCKRAGSNLCMGHRPGEELGAKIAEMMSNKRVVWAHHGGVNRLPAKDPDDMDDEVIRYSIKNAIPHFEYALDL